MLWWGLLPRFTEISFNAYFQWHLHDVLGNLSPLNSLYDVFLASWLSCVEYFLFPGPLLSHQMSRRFLSFNNITYVIDTIKKFAHNYKRKYKNKLNIYC